MEINTTRFGPQQVDPTNALFFPNGLPGFEKDRRFQLLHETNDNPVLYYIQSLDNPNLTLHAVVASHFGLYYEIMLSDEDMLALGSESPEAVSILCVVSKDNNSEDDVVPHPACPVIINTETKRGIQMKVGQVKINC
jgi:flagellar assembly factor FliW